MYPSEFIFFSFQYRSFIFYLFILCVYWGEGIFKIVFLNSPSHSGVHFVEQAGFEVQTSACLCFRVRALEYKF